MVSAVEAKIEYLNETRKSLENTLADAVLHLLAKKCSELSSLVVPTIEKANKKLLKYSECETVDKIDKAIKVFENYNKTITNHMNTINSICSVITTTSYKTGFRDIPMIPCSTSYVDPQKGVHYAEHPISTLKQSSVEETVHLLETGTLDHTAYKEKFQQAAQQPMPPFTIISHSNPMKVFAAALLSIEEMDFKSIEEEALFLEAHMPYIIASVINKHAGWGETPSYDPNLGYIENFVSMLQMPEKKEMTKEQLERLTDLFRLFFVLHCDHGGGNLSTVVGRFVASALPPLADSLSVATIALNAPLHGGANRDAFEVANAAVESENISDFIIDFLEKAKIFPGFGHAVLRQDPRHTILADYSKEHFAADPLAKAALDLSETAPDILKEKRPKIRNPNPNVDQISGAALAAAGFNYPQFFTLLFCAARVLGITTQIVDDRKEGIPLIRPGSFYQAREEQEHV